MAKKTNEYSLDDLLNGDGSDDLANNLAEQNGLNLIDNIVIPMDYEEEQSKTVRKAKKTLLSLLEFYLTKEFINENTYLEHKLKLEESTLSGLMHQIKLNEKMIHTIMRIIDNGMITPDIFREFSNLQKIYIELSKTKTMHLINIEENVKRLKSDYDFYKGQSNGPTAKLKDGVMAIEDDEENIYRGTKDFLNDLDEDE